MEENKILAATIAIFLTVMTILLSEFGHRILRKLIDFYEKNKTQEA